MEPFFEIGQFLVDYSNKLEKNSYHDNYEKGNHFF